MKDRVRIVLRENGDADLTTNEESKFKTVKVRKIIGSKIHVQ